VPGAQWIAHEWGWEVLLASAYASGGFLGIWGLVLAASVAVGWGLRKALTGSGVADHVATIAAALGVVLLLGWLKPWPQAGVYVMFTSYLVLAAREEWKRREILAALVVGCVWANLHSTAVMFPLLLMVEAAWLTLVCGKPLRMRLCGALAAGVGTLINPHGIELWRYAVVEGLLSREYRDVIMEWMPYDFGSYGLAFVFFFCAVVLFAAVRQAMEKELVFLRASGFWTLALLSRIYTPYAVMSTAMVLGRLELGLSEKSFRRLLVVFCLGGLLLTGKTVFQAGIPVDLDSAAHDDGYPAAAVSFIKKSGYQRVFNPHGWGGYLIWRDVPVYIDGRNDLYKQTLKEYLNLFKSRQRLGERLLERGADSVLTSPDTALSAVLRESRLWEEVYSDDVAVVFARAQSPDLIHSKPLERGY
jgi:hypothetical protein